MKFPLVAMSFALSNLLTAAPAKLAEKDLALAFPLETENLIGFSEKMSDGNAIFPQTWYAEIMKAYEQTPVGDTLERENIYSDWRIVSARIVPCNPLGNSPLNNIEAFCWPEVRLVWQPVLRKILLHSRFMQAMGDDRAMHASYPLSSLSALTADEARRADAYKARVLQAMSLLPFKNPLNEGEFSDFIGLRNKISARLLKETIALRGIGLPPASFSGHGLRPEFIYGSAADEKEFLVRFQGFLRKYANRADLEGMTSFSLPEGREPAHTDEWIFLSFVRIGSELKSREISLHSPKDGRLLLRSPSSASVSSTRDDDVFYGDSEALIGNLALLFSNDRERLFDKIADRKQTLVPNTTCGSCHKLNDLNFDLHNFGYLEDRELTISPRVKLDVKHDLDWIAGSSVAQ